MTSKPVLITGIAISLVVGFALGFSFAGVGKSYSGYEECIFGEIQKAKSDRSAMIIGKACKTLYPETNPFDKFDEK